MVERRDVLKSLAAGGRRERQAYKEGTEYAGQKSHPLGDATYSLFAGDSHLVAFLMQVKLRFGWKERRFVPRTASVDDCV